LKQFIYNNAGALSLTWALFIFALCAIPGPYVPSASWMELLRFDKLVHAGLFFMLCALLLLWDSKEAAGRDRTLMWVVLCVSYGVVLEVLQAAVFVERTMDFYDATANLGGTLIAFGLRNKLRGTFATRA
jgi:VanZ family protein